MRFNGKLATVPSWQRDGDRHYNSVTLKTSTIEGKCCGLKPNPMWRSRPAQNPVLRVVPATGYANVFDGRRGAVRKSSFDVCLNDFEWEKPDERETRYENKSSWYIKSARIMIPGPARYSFRFQRASLIYDLSEVIGIRKRKFERVVYFSIEWIKCAQLAVYWLIDKRALIYKLFRRARN